MSLDTIAETCITLKEKIFFTDNLDRLKRFEKVFGKKTEKKSSRSRSNSKEKVYEKEEKPL